MSSVLDRVIYVRAAARGEESSVRVCRGDGKWVDVSFDGAARAIAREREEG